MGYDAPIRRGRTGELILSWVETHRHELLQLIEAECETCADGAEEILCDIWTRAEARARSVRDLHELDELMKNLVREECARRKRGHTWLSRWLERLLAA